VRVAAREDGLLYPYLVFPVCPYNYRISKKIYA
jgi:hypothetical protein